MFERYPVLKEALPHIALADLPTPVERATKMGEALGLERLYVKRDDLTGREYGGNKVRKLEFLLARAIEKGAKEVMTFGCAGSNHAAATAFYAQKVGLRSISMLLPQPNAHSVRWNLLLSFRCGAELHAYRGARSVAIGVRVQRMRHRLTTGVHPETIPAGGSSALGAVGYVNAAFELAGQVDEGQLPEPDRIYVAAGTTGTAAGLILGLRAAGLKSKVVAVRVTGERFANVARILALLVETNMLLHACAPAFPRFSWTEEDVCLRHDMYGGQYALYTEASVASVRLARETEDIRLDGTYTGKAFAALMSDAANKSLEGKTALFWDTYNSRDVSRLIAGVDYHELPRAFHRYFEEDVQPLDRDTHPA